MDKKKIFIIIGSIIAIILTIFIVFIVNNNKKTITYDISFETNGGTTVATQTVNEGEKVEKPLDPTKEGYIFVEWTYQGEAYDFSLKVTSDLVLIAKWVEIEEDIETFIVRFDSDGGSTISNQIIKKGNKVEKPLDPTKEGYIFKGWTLNDESYDFEKIVEQNLELKAKWEEENATNNDTSNNNSSSNNNNNNTTETTTPTEKKFTVAFDSNGGSAVTSQTITEGNKATQPSNPTRNGYTFTGWTLNGNAYDFNTTVTNDITLTANWKEIPKNNYTVTFDSNGGSSVASQTVTEGSKATQPSNPTKEGYNFTGWTLNGSAYNFNNTVNQNITLVASWNQKNYKITTTKADAYSPDAMLNVYEDGNLISVKAIKYIDGPLLCNGTNTTVAFLDIEGETKFIVVLNGGTEVTATIQ